MPPRICFSCLWTGFDRLDRPAPSGSSHPPYDQWIAGPSEDAASGLAFSAGRQAVLVSVLKHLEGVQNNTAVKPRKQLEYYQVVRAWPDICANRVIYVRVTNSFIRNLVAAGHLHGEHPSRVDSVPGCPQSLHVLRSVGSYRVLIRACVVEIDEWVIRAQSLRLLLDLTWCKPELSLDHHGNKNEKKSTGTRNTHIVK